METTTRATTTPGPWAIYSQDPYSCIWVIGPEPESLFLAKIHEGFDGDPKPVRETLKANARLIAAVPDLLEAICIIPPDRLEILADWFDTEQRKRTEWLDDDLQRDLRRMAQLARAAIAKATRA